MIHNCHAVIFDYGNTLVLDPFYRIIEEKADDLRKALPQKYKDQWEKIVEKWELANEVTDKPFVSHFYQEDFILEKALKEARVDQKDIFSLTRRIMNLYRKRFVRLLSEDTRRLEVKETLLFLKHKGLRLGVLSNEKDFALKLALRCYEIVDLFDVVLSSERIGVEKPETKAFCDILKALESDPEKTVYVGDDPMQDMLPAKKLGMKVIMFEPPSDSARQTSWRKYPRIGIKVEYVIKSLAELREIFKNVGTDF